MRRRAFIAGAAALAASPVLPVGPVGAGEWWSPKLLGTAMDAEPGFAMFGSRIIWTTVADGMLCYDCDKYTWEELA